MFKPKDVGRKIIVHDTNGAAGLHVGFTYVIRSVINSQTVLLQGLSVNWYVSDPSMFEFIDEDKKSDLSIGDQIRLETNTQNLKKGEQFIIKDFVDGDNYKIIVDGVTPGGWISASKVKKLIDLSKYRIKTFFEIMEEFGKLTMPFEMTGGRSELAYMFGRNMAEIGCVQEHDYIRPKEAGSLMLTPAFYKSIDSPIEDCDILIDHTRLSFKNTKLPGSPQELENVSLFSVSKYKKTNESLFELCEDLFRRERIPVGKSFWVYSNGLKLAKVKQNSPPEAVTDPLFF